MKITTTTAVHFTNDTAGHWTPMDFRIEVSTYANGIGFVATNEFLLTIDSARELIGQLERKLDILANR